MDAYEDEQQELHDRRQQERKQMKRAKAEIERLRAALKPLADIKLWSDSYPDCRTDHIMGDWEINRFVTVDQIKAARLAFADAQEEIKAG